MYCEGIANYFSIDQYYLGLFAQAVKYFIFLTAKTLPSRPGMPAPLPPTASPQVRAVYTFAATVETQLSFNEGDILVLLGEKSDGWQYGQNTKTGR